jgi:hypothetical protein
MIAAISSDVIWRSVASPAGTPAFPASYYRCQNRRLSRFFILKRDSWFSHHNQITIPIKNVPEKSVIDFHCKIDPLFFRKNRSPDCNFQSLHNF